MMLPTQRIEHGRERVVFCPQGVSRVCLRAIPGGEAYMQRVRFQGIVGAFLVGLVLQSFPASVLAQSQYAAMQLLTRTGAVVIR